MAGVKPIINYGGVTKEIATGDTVPFANLNLNGSFIGKTIVVYKSADETVTTSNSLQDDDHIKTPTIAANETWDGVLITQQVVGAGNAKYDWTSPSGSTARMTGTGTMFGFADRDCSTGFSSSSTVTVGAASPGVMMLHFATAATPGVFQFRFAQASSNAAATTMKGGTLLILTRTA